MLLVSIKFSISSIYEVCTNYITQINFKKIKWQLTGKFHLFKNTLISELFIQLQNNYVPFSKYTEDKYQFEVGSKHQ